MKAVVFVKMSERFPGKHRIVVKGKQIIDYELERIERSGCFEDLIVLSKDKFLTTKNARIMNDQTEGTLVDSMLFALEQESEFMAFAGDMPLVSPEFIRDMCSLYHGKPIVPRWKNGKLEPMMAIYNESLIPGLKSYIKSGKKSLKDFILTSDFLKMEIPDGKYMENSFLNINYPDELLNLEKML